MPPYWPQKDEKSKHWMNNSNFRDSRNPFIHNLEITTNHFLEIQFHDTTETQFPIELASSTRTSFFSIWNSNSPFWWAFFSPCWIHSLQNRFLSLIFLTKDYIFLFSFIFIHFFFLFLDPYPPFYSKKRFKMDLYESISFNSHFLLKPILFSILSSNTQAVLEFQKRLFKPLFVKPYDPENNFVIEQSDRIPYFFDLHRFYPFLLKLEMCSSSLKRWPMTTREKPSPILSVCLIVILTTACRFTSILFPFCCSRINVDQESSAVLSICSSKQSKERQNWPMNKLPFANSISSSFLFTHSLLAVLSHVGQFCCSIDDIRCMLVPFRADSRMIIHDDYSKMFFDVFDRVCERLRRHWILLWANTSIPPFIYTSLAKEKAFTSLKPSSLPMGTSRFFSFSFLVTPSQSPFRFTPFLLSPSGRTVPIWFQSTLCLIVPIFMSVSSTRILWLSMKSRRRSTPKKYTPILYLYL